MKSIRIVTALIILSGVFFAIASNLLPVPAAVYDPHAAIHSYLPTEAAFRSTLRFVALSTTLNLGAVLLFLLGLRGFRTAFRHTYYWICAGLAVQSVGSIAYLVSVYLGTAGSDAATLINELPLALGIVMIFYGLFRFARLLQASVWVARPWAIALIYATAMAVVAFLPPKAGVTSNEPLFVAGHMVFFTETLFYLLCAFLAAGIRGQASRLYARSMLWFSIAVLTAFMASSLLFGESYLAYPDWLTTDLLGSIFIVTNALSMVSAYFFHRITHFAPAKAQTSQNEALLDSVMFLASLVSHPQEVDPILDKVRLITGRHEAGTSFNEAETRELQAVTTSLIDYLATQERLRSFDRAELANLIQERFGLAVGS